MELNTSILYIDISHNERLIATSNEIGYVCLWDMKTYKKNISFTKLTSAVDFLRFSPDDLRLYLAE